MPDTLARLDKTIAKYEGKSALDIEHLELPEGKIIALCGPNGSGKSTALRVLRGLHPPASGTVEIAGRPLSGWTPKALAREVAMLSQSPNAPDEMSVADLVMLGRYAHQRPFAGPSMTDREACARAITATHLDQLTGRALSTLSGGQLQRAWIAMTLAQEAPRIFLDEPTNHLDITHAFEVLELIVDLNRRERRSFVIVLHDLNMAMRYADHVVLFDQGRCVASGLTRSVLCPERIQDIFEIECILANVSPDGVPTIVTVPINPLRSVGK